MTVYLRLLAGLTSFMSKRCFVHWPATGPDGILASRFMVSPNGGVAGEAEQHGQGHGDVAGRDDDGERETNLLDRRGDTRAVPAERLERTGDAVAQVQPEDHLGDDIDGDDQRVAEPGHDHRVDV